MKRISLSFLCLLAVMILFNAGCSTGSSPKEVISKYLDNYYHGNHEKAYELLSSRDKAVRSLQEFSVKEAEFSAMRKAISSKITFTVKDVKVTGDKALATVDVTAPDLSGAMGELFSAAFSQVFTGGKPDEKAMEKIVTEKMKDKNLPTSTKTEHYDLIKEKDGWRVYMDWENEKKIKQLKNEAEKLEKQKKFTESRSKYSEIQSISSRDGSVTEKIKGLDEKIVQYKEKQVYFPKIEVKNVHIGKDILGRKGVFGEIKNKGDKTLKRVEITTYCLDMDGNVVFEKPYSAVLVSEHSFSMRGNQPLKPNYSQQFGCKLDDAPSDWSGKVKVEVTDLDFE